MRAIRSTGALLVLFCLAQLLGSCATAPTPTDRPGDSQPAAAGLAQRLYVRLQEEYASGRYGAALSLAYEIMDHHA